ncbi:hypothetical protein NQ318_002749 [Aromia moschata]|uniref:Protein kinase domain-containing protein n=1 Tax=Aromia moschata TaxID=1265417 RepID=A0AAV8Y4Y4_9CUCU|nr:hypothetical protein NQ318_002749 [Aromia moschata]
MEIEYRIVCAEGNAMSTGSQMARMAIERAYHTVNMLIDVFFSFAGGYIGKDGSKVTTVVATPGQGPDRPQEVSYTDTKVIGNGSFGVVYQAKLCETSELVAIKKVLQDKRFKNRELQIMRKLEHCNIVKLKYFFYSSGDKSYLGSADDGVLESVPPVEMAVWTETQEKIRKHLYLSYKRRTRLRKFKIKWPLYRLLGKSVNPVHSLSQVFDKSGQRFHKFGKRFHEFGHLQSLLMDGQTKDQ